MEQGGIVWLEDGKPMGGGWVEGAGQLGYPDRDLKSCV